MTRHAKRSSPRRSGAGRGRFFAGMATGATLVLLGLLGYFYFGRPPVAVTDKAALWEPLITPMPLRQRARFEAKTAPFAANEEVFEAGAHTYRAHCAQCHGVPGQESTLGGDMVPRAQQFFDLRQRNTMNAQPAGELFWKTAFGIRRSGMPAYTHVLSNMQLWQVSLLLHGTGGDLPEPVRAILTEGVPSRQPTSVIP